MVRSASAVLAVLALPGFLLAQQAPATHTVVDGDTLWDLANRYYSNPFDWRVIWNANQGAIDNPNLIVPGQVITIPGVDGPPPAPVTDVVIEEAAPAPMAAAPAEEPEHTIFYSNPATLVSSATGGAMATVAVSRDQVYSSPWLIPLETLPASLGTLERFATGSGRSETPRSYDRVIVQPRGTTFRVGDVLRTYRITRTVEDVGEVVTPTGILTITDVGPDGAVAVVVKEYHRIALGDLVGPLPPYALTAGGMPQPVMGGSQAMVMGFASPNVIQDLGAIAFLDLGADEGIVVGDEFEYVNDDAGAVVEGRLQVVGVTPTTASARVVDLDDDVFEQGVVVRLSRKMR